MSNPTRSAENASEGIVAAANDAASSANDTIDRTRSSAAKGLETAASALRHNVSELPGGERVGRLAHGAADRLDDTAKYVRRNNLNGMAADLTRLVKNNPGPSLLVAAAFGFIVGRAMTRE